MAINDAFTLPKRVRAMEHMADLLQAEQAELDLAQQIITGQEDQLYLGSSTYALKRHEAMFAITSSAGDTVQERRARLIAKLNTRSPATIAAIKELVMIIIGCASEVIEHPAEYRFEVKFTGTRGVPANLAGLTAAIEEIKPAHLAFGYIFTYTTWDDIDAYPYIWDKWDALDLTWDEMEIYKE